MTSDGCELLSPIIRLLQRGSIDSLCLSVDHHQQNQHVRNSFLCPEVLVAPEGSVQFNVNAGTGLSPDLITSDYPRSPMSPMSPMSVSITQQQQDLSSLPIAPPMPLLAPADPDSIGHSHDRNGRGGSFVFPSYSPVFPSSFLSSLASPSFAAATAAATTPMMFRQPHQRSFADASASVAARPVFGRTSFPAPDLLSTYFRVPANINPNAPAHSSQPGMMQASGSASLSHDSTVLTTMSTSSGHPLALQLPGVVAVPSFDPLPSPSFATGLNHSFSVPMSSASNERISAVPTVDLSSFEHATRGYGGGGGGAMVSNSLSRDSLSTASGGMGKGNKAPKQAATLWLKDKIYHSSTDALPKKGLTIRDIEQARLSAVRAVEKAMGSNNV
jgi:hypothetical protein